MADGSVLIDTKLDTSPVQKGLSTLKGLFDGSGVAAAGKAAFTGITAAVTAAGTALTAMGGFAVKTGMEFDTAMSQVAATMGVSVDSIEGMRTAAIKYGAETAFSATEAAEALNNLASAGYDADKAVEVLPSVLNLAAAGGLDLAYASQIATSSMAALGIEATNENLTKFGDEMAKTAAAADTSVSQLGEAILTVGGTAKKLAGNTIELNTALGILSNNGIRGSEAGTALRNIIQSLVSPTDIARKAMKKLGVQVADSNGKMRPLNEIMADFNEATADMSDVVKADYLSQIFNKTDLAAVEALLANCGTEWEELEAAIMDSEGAMAQMAETQLDNLKGDVENLTGALESLGIAASDEVKDTLREIVQLGEAMVVRLTEALTTGGFSAFASELGSVLADGLVELTAYLPQLVTMGSDVITSLVQGITENSDQIATSIGDALGAIATAVIGLLPELTVAAASLILSLAERIPTLLKLVFSAIKDADWAQIGTDILNLLVGAFSNWTDTAGDIGTFVSTLVTGISTSLTSEDGGSIATALGSLVAGITSDDMLTAASTLAQTLFDALVSGISSLTSGAASLAEAFAGFMSGMNKEDFGADIGTVATTIVDAIVDAIASIAKTPDMSSLVVSIGDGIRESISFLGDIAGELADYITSAEGIESLVNAGGSLATAVFAGLTSAFHGMAAGLIDLFGSVFGSIATNLLEAFGLDPEKVKADVDEFFGSLFSESGNVIGEMTDAQLKAYGYQLTNGMGTVLEQAQAWVALEAAGYGDIFGQYASTSFNTAGVALAKALADGFGGDASSQAHAMAALMINGMGDGLVQKYPELAAAANKLIDSGFAPSIEEACQMLDIPIPDTIAEALGQQGEAAIQAGENISTGGDKALEGAEKFGQADELLDNADATATEVAEDVIEKAAEASTAVTEIEAAAESAATASETVVTAQESVSAAATTMATDAAAALETLNLTAESITLAVETMMTSLANTITAGTEALSLAASGAGNAVLVGFQTELGIADEESTVFATMGSTLVTSIAKGIETSATMTAFSTAATGVYTAVKSALDVAIGANGSKFNTVGKNICKGVVKGIEEGKSSVISAAVQMAVDAYAAACGALGINSPSRKFAEIGMYCAMGMANGLVDNADAFVGAYRGMIDSARSYIVSSDLFGAAAERMHMAVEARTRSAIEATGFADAHFIDYQELARAIWEEAPEELGVTQTINFYEPVQTPDETARAIRYNNTQGLVGGKR